jgi:PPOX class probable F420-dependent enzyme
MTDVIPSSHKDILDKNGFLVLSTLGRDGSPQQSTVWYAWDGDALKVSTTTERQKHRNISRDPRVSGMILDPDDPYRYLEVRGEATIAPDPKRELIEELSQRDTGGAFDDPAPDEDRVIIRIRPSRAATMG